MDYVVDLDQARALLAGLPHAMVLIDEDRNLLLSNQDPVEMGQPRSCARGACHWELHRVPQPVAGCPLDEVLETGIGVEHGILDPLTGRWVRIGIYPTGLRTEAGSNSTTVFF